MKLQLLVSTGMLLVALLPCQECRAVSKSPPGAPRQPDFFPQQQQQQQQQQQTLPVLLRMGEEYFLRLGNLDRRPVASLPAPSSGTGHEPPEGAAELVRAAAPERPPGGPAGDAGAVEREKRSEEPPISLDLTFHLLREVLEMARAEQLAQQAHSNRKLMEIIGK
ncbi:corticoliberin [Nothoprocta perdicaria]|uniref:Corticotropin releasing hormone n=1 Tax=Nothoprocta perdicaria TaxID=30464 RepID=A0A8C6YHI0_NOTPE|nr:corticoliberin [Nothoprocta perdicaria]